MTTGRAGVFPVSTAGIVVDVSDRDARLLGRVKLLNAAGVVINPANEHVLANDPASVRLTDGAAFYDARQIRALTAADVVDASDRVARQLGIIASITAAVDVSDRDARLLGRVKLLDAGGAVYDARGPATLHVTGTAAVNTGLTITLPAPGAGLSQYITSLQWFKRYSVLGVAAGAGVIITSTNLPGNPAWDTEQLASPAGTVVRVIDYQATGALKAAVANTAVTVVAPAQLQTIWRGNISYFVAP